MTEERNTENKNNDQPPFLKTWTMVYRVLLISQLLIVLAFYLMTIKYSG